MKISTTLALLPLLGLVLATSAQTSAQTTVWRCGTQGNVYSDSPCAEGRAVSLMPSGAVGSPPGEAARREARALALLQAERRERMALAAPAGGIKPEAAAAAKARRPIQARQAPSADETWRAVAPASRQKKG